MNAHPEHTQETDVVHGGVISALADTAAVHALIPTLLPGQLLTSIEFKLNFVRPALPDKGLVRARARVLQRGRKVGLCEVKVTQAGRSVAHGLFTYMFLTPE